MCTDESLSWSSGLTSLHGNIHLGLMQNSCWPFPSLSHTHTWLLPYRRYAGPLVFLLLLSSRRSRTLPAPSDAGLVMALLVGWWCPGLYEPSLLRCATRKAADPSTAVASPIALPPNNTLVAWEAKQEGVSQQRIKRFFTLDN